MFLFQTEVLLSLQKWLFWMEECFDIPGEWDPMISLSANASSLWTCVRACVRSRLLFMHVFIYVSLFPCFLVCLFPCLFVCLCVCVCVCVYVILRACNVRDVSVLVLIRTFQWILSSCMFLSFFWFILTSLLIQINLAWNRCTYFTNKFTSPYFEFALILNCPQKRLLLVCKRVMWEREVLERSEIPQQSHRD